MLTGLVTLQAALCAAQCSFWHALLQYSTLLHALHLLRPPLGQQGTRSGGARLRCSDWPTRLVTAPGQRSIASSRAEEP
jgi:hypothetical protein